MRGKRLGFTLEECKEIIDLYDRADITSEIQLVRLLQKIREHRAQLLLRIQDIESTLSAMDEVEKDSLAALADLSQARD